MDSREALRLIALEVVGVTNPDDVHDDEMLRWGDIRNALHSKPAIVQAPYTPVRAPDGTVEFRSLYEGKWPVDEPTPEPLRQIRPSINNRVAMRTFDLPEEKSDER